MVKKRIIKALIGLTLFIVLVYSAIIVYLLTQKTRLVFYENYEKPSHTVPPAIMNLKYQHIDLHSEDVLKLSGWIILPDRDSLTSPWLIFCHGNASDISFPDYVARYKIFSEIGLNVLCFDYRGFGESDGKPSEAGLYKDAIASYNYLTRYRQIPFDRIIIYGHSLGASVAIDLASHVPAAGLVVEAGFQSIPETARQIYPFLPMHLIVRNKFPSIDKIERVLIPKLFIHSSDDIIIPISDGMALYKKALPPKRFLEIKGSHDAAPIESKESFTNGLLSFLKETTAEIK
jgi:uncharacterized protein